MKNLKHNNIVKILETIETEKYILIIMENIPGGDLLNFVKKRTKLPEKTAKFIFKQLILALKYMHNHNIIHRDIKLDNILIDLNNNIKLCDFGVSKLISNKNEILNEQCGTPAYIAPEILLNEGYEGPPVDIWSSGVVLYAMLFGSVPFKANGLKDLHKLILEGKVIFKSNNNSYISNEAKDLILNLLKVDPKERINIDEILNHPWMVNANNNNIDDEKNINLFTKAETVLLSKENIDYRNEDNNGMMVENFTLKNLDTLKEIENKDVNTKSVILAPFNTSYENDEIDKLNNIDIKNDIIDFNENAKVLNRMYELNNNVEIDHGVLKNKTTSSSNDNNNNNNNNDNDNIVNELNAINNINTNYFSNNNFYFEPYLISNNDPNFNYPEISPPEFIGTGLKHMNGYISPITLQELKKVRDNFWSSRIEGNPEVWELLHAICNDNTISNEDIYGMLNAGGIKPYKDCINITFDNKGALYEIPNYCINDPMKYEISDIEYDKKTPKSDIINFIVRYYEKEEKIKKKNKISVLQLKEEINKRNKKYKIDKIRLFFGGKELNNEKPIWFYNIDNKNIVQMIIKENDESEKNNEKDANSIISEKDNKENDKENTEDEKSVYMKKIKEKKIEDKKNNENNNKLNDNNDKKNDIYNNNNKLNYNNDKNNDINNNNNKLNDNNVNNNLKDNNYNNKLNINKDNNNKDNNNNDNDKNNNNDNNKEEFNENNKNQNYQNSEMGEILSLNNNLNITETESTILGNNHNKINNQNNIQEDENYNENNFLNTSNSDNK